MIDLSLLKRLCLLNGVSGDEGKIRDFIISEIKDYAEYHTDNLGNLIVFKKGKNRAKKKLMLAAHMDEVGLIVTDVGSDGLLRFDEVGGIDRRVLPARSVVVGNGVNGVIGVKPIHLCEDGEETKIPKMSDMYIDIGAVDKSDAEKRVSLGDSVYFEPCYSENDYSIISKAIDDRFGCFVLINMIKSDLEYDLYFVFTVQEEIGLRGAGSAAYSVAPDFALVLEATTASDYPDAIKTVCAAGEGAVVGYMDRRTIYDKGLVKRAAELSERDCIKLQFKKAVAGGNDAGSIHTSRGGVRTLAISIACRYLHAQNSLIFKSDVEDILRLATALAADVAGGKL